MSNEQIADDLIKEVRLTPIALKFHDSLVKRLRDAVVAMSQYKERDTQIDAEMYDIDILLDEIDAAQKETP